MELLIAVAFVAVLSVLGIYSYSGYTTTSQSYSAQNTLKLIALAQSEHKSELGYFFCSDPDPTIDDSVNINSSLFSGHEILKGNDYYLLKSTGIKADGSQLSAQECSSSPELATGYILKAIMKKTSETYCLKDNGNENCN